MTRFTRLLAAGALLSAGCAVAKQPKEFRLGDAIYSTRQAMKKRMKESQVKQLSKEAQSYLNKPNTFWMSNIAGSRYRIAYKIDETTFGNKNSEKYKGALKGLQDSFDMLYKYIALEFGEWGKTKSWELPAWMKFTNNGGCWSRLGRIVQTGGQEVSIGEGCWQVNTVIHEILHALGWDHEQVRKDRDDHITVIYKNINKQVWNQFHKDENSLIVKHSPYDLKSVMHYYWNEFSIDPDTKAVFVVKDKTKKLHNGPDMPPDVGVSDLDVFGLNTVYSMQKLCERNNQTWAFYDTAKKHPYLKKGKGVTTRSTCIKSDGTPGTDTGDNNGSNTGGNKGEVTTPSTSKQTTPSTNKETTPSTNNGGKDDSGKDDGNTDTGKDNGDGDIGNYDYNYNDIDYDQADMYDKNNDMSKWDKNDDWDDDWGKMYDFNEFPDNVWDSPDINAYDQYFDEFNTVLNGDNDKKLEDWNFDDFDYDMSNYDYDYGSDYAQRQGNGTKCKTPIDGVINQLDQTIRPFKESGKCATGDEAKNFEIKSKIYWKSCADKKLTKFNQWTFMKVKDQDYGYIRAFNHPDRCWSILNVDRAWKQTLFLKRCKGQPRQRFVLKDGRIYLAHKGSNNDKTFCVAFEEGDKLRTRRCFMNQLGGQ